MKYICAAVFWGLALSPTGYAQFTYYSPHIVIGSLGGGHSFQTVFQLVNPSPTEQVDFTIKLKKNDGSPLLGFTAPETLIPTSQHSSKMFVLSAGRIWANPRDEGEETSGWATIEATGPLMISVLIQGTTATCAPNPDPGVCSSVIAANNSTTLTEASGRDLVFAAGFNSSPYFATGIAVLNPSASQVANLTLQLLETNGSPSREVTFSLAPQTKIAQFTHELGLFPTTGGGTVRLRSSESVSVAVVEIRDGAWISIPLGTVP